jgi:hypothetical protein
VDHFSLVIDIGPALGIADGVFAVYLPLSNIIAIEILVNKIHSIGH